MLPHPPDHWFVLYAMSLFPSRSDDWHVGLWEFYWIHNYFVCGVSLVYVFVYTYFMLFKRQ